MELQKAFEDAVTRSKQLNERPSNEVLLKLYALYKQATEGDNNNERPGGFDFRAIAKHDAWAEQNGKSKEVCIQEYIDLVDSLS
ncbi:acyl-CoA-binding protein [Fulvivirgaceae bacterium BMA10]|uniref:Acyl-CoA-binding protein n=1 Tax=Splendidivirga corallicola TaxID=3051826 RepID=A0ABT8KSY7_9BACT|nr:acyl-CoA-binding protein [Fulvivirgaceae bacterium BMA10]